MDKFVVMPQVVVYQNMFSEEQVKKILEVVQQSETYTADINPTAPEESAINDFHGDQPYLENDYDLIMKWMPWYTFGLRSKVSEKYVDPVHHEYNKEQYDFREKVKGIINDIFYDYANDYKDSQWPEFIDHWYIDQQFGFSEIEILKHYVKPSHEYAILFHTDRHEHRIDIAGGKQIITFTMYLNDDYTGGEVEFIDEAENKLISYKPKAGDVTVFPAGLPFWHAAKAVTKGNNKIFLRVFASWEHVGSQEYQDGVKKYGKEAYDKIMMDRGRETVSTNVVGRQVIRVGENPNILKTKAILINDENRIYINGKDVYQERRYQ